MTGEASTRQPWPRWVSIVGLAVAYTVAAWLGLLVASHPGNVTALWPASGIALASLLVGGRRLWPGVLLGSFVANLIASANDVDGLAAVGAGLIAIGSTAEIVVATVLVERFAGGRGLLDTPRHVMRLSVIAGVAAGLAATTGLIATVGIVGADVDRVAFWLTWWIGDVVGMLVIGPIACSGRLTFKRPMEWVVTIAVTLAVGEWLFGRPFGLSHGTDWPVLWAILPAVVWSAVRLDPRAVAMQVLLILVLASWSTVTGSGPFVAEGAAGPLLLDAMLIVTNATGLLLVASVRQTQASHQTLEDRVAERGAALELAWAEAAASLEEKGRLRATVVEAQKQEALGRLAGGVAHDFNNLLMVIRAEADHISCSSDVNDDIKETATTIVAAADSAADLTRQLLAVARRPMARVVPIDVVDALRRFQRLARPALPASIRFVTTPGPAAWVAMDAGHLDQVLLNLVLNAKDALLEGGMMQLRHSVETLTDSDATARDLIGGGAWVAIDVTDSGTGIAPDIVSRIFEPFFTTKAVGTGSGLGLPTAASLVAQAGGVLTVTSTTSEGTTFRVWLPAVSEPTTTPASDGGDERLAPVAMPRPRTILVVEDEAMVRRTIVMALTRRGHRVLEASDGAEGLATFTAHETTIDLVITDVVMPRMGGLAMLQAIRLVRPTPTVIISGYHEHQGELGAERVLVKPFSIEALEVAVHDALVTTSA